MPVRVRRRPLSMVSWAGLPHKSMNTPLHLQQSCGRQTGAPIILYMVFRHTQRMRPEIRNNVAIIQYALEYSGLI